MKIYTKLKAVNKKRKTMSKQTSPAVHKALSNYIAFINQEVIANHGKSYMTPENTGNKWRGQIEHSVVTEEFLLNMTKMYILNMDSRDSKSTNLLFLKSLINEISDFLSKYFVRGRNINRNQMTKQIKEILWNKNHHIQYLQNKQQQRKDASDKQSYIKQQNKEKRLAKAKLDYSIAQQVKNEFVEARNRYNKR